MTLHELQQPTRARDMLIRIPVPDVHSEQTVVNPAAVRRRVIARPWEMGHSVAWLIWLIGGLATVMQTSNPLYLALLWGLAVLVWSACANDGALANTFGLLIKFGAVIFALNIIFSVITAGALRGQTVIAHLPSVQLPKLLGGLELGGIVSLEQIVSGAVKGLRLWTLLVLVGAFNSCVNHYRLLRRVPRFMYQAGLVTTIALAFVPQTVLRLQSIREAQRLRGHRFRSWRDALPLFVPLLSGGMERAMQLSEAMEARGYGRSMVKTKPQSPWMNIMAVLSLMLGSFGFFYYGSHHAAHWFGLIGMILGGMILVWNWWRLSRQIKRSRYSREIWAWQASIITISACVAPLGMWLLARFGVSLNYQAFPLAHLPPFEPLVAIPLLLLAMPAVLIAASPRRS